MAGLSWSSSSRVRSADGGRMRPRVSCGVWLEGGCDWGGCLAVHGLVQTMDLHIRLFGCQRVREFAGWSESHQEQVTRCHLSMCLQVLGIFCCQVHSFYSFAVVGMNGTLLHPVSRRAVRVVIALALCVCKKPSASNGLVSLPLWLGGLGQGPVGQTYSQ